MRFHPLEAEGPVLFNCEHGEFGAYLDQAQSLGRRIGQEPGPGRTLEDLSRRVCSLLSCECCLIAFQDDLVDRCYSYSRLEEGPAPLGRSTVCLQLHPFNFWFDSRKEFLDNQPGWEVKLFLRQYGIELRNYLCLPLLHEDEDQPLGIMLAMNKETPFSRPDKDLLDSFRTVAVSTIWNYRRVKELQALFGRTLEMMAEAVDSRGNLSRGHSRRVSCYTRALAQSLGWSKGRTRLAEVGGLLHDIGMIGVPVGVLEKAGPLSPGERELVRRHVGRGVEMIRPLLRLGGAMAYILFHHERWDGHGYGSALTGEEIPLEGRMVAIADSFDAMVFPQAYRLPLSPREAAEELLRCAGAQFDPILVQGFIALYRAGTFDRVLAERERPAPALARKASGL